MVTKEISIEKYELWEKLSKFPEQIMKEYESAISHNESEESKTAQKDSFLIYKQHFDDAMENI